MSINIASLTHHPEELGKDTLYVRLLLLKNLYLLHDPTFDEELRRAAIYITERKRLFDLIEAPHYQLRDEKPAQKKGERTGNAASSGDRTTTLIDSFLHQIPHEEQQPKNDSATNRNPTPADATIDYVA